MLLLIVVVVVAADAVVAVVVAAAVVVGWIFDYRTVDWPEDGWLDACLVCFSSVWFDFVLFGFGGRLVGRLVGLGFALFCLVGRLVGLLLACLLAWSVSLA